MNFLFRGRCDVELAPIGFDEWEGLVGAEPNDVVEERQSLSSVYELDAPLNLREKYGFSAGWQGARPCALL